jgi:hypothetical protein
MKPSDVFGIIVRSIGVLILLYDAFLISVVIFEVLGLPIRHVQTLPVDELYAAAFLLMGLCCLFGARFIACAAYWGERN